MTQFTSEQATAAAATPLGPNDAHAETVGDYLRKLLATLWREGEGFSSKRPFGNSDWQEDVVRALVRDGLVTGSFDEEGYLYDADYDAADELVLEVISRLAVS